MVSNRFLFGLFCLAAAGSIALPDRNRVENGLGKERNVGAGLPKPRNVGVDRTIKPIKKSATTSSGEKEGAGVPVPNRGAAAVVRAAQAEIGVREFGENAGPRVDEYNRYTGVKDAAWCASFASFCFYKAGFAQPRTAWSPALFPRERCIAEVAPGHVLGIYYSSKGRIAHCGIVIKPDGDWVFSIEGNTNNSGSREGDGVYAKKRHRRTITKYADWLGASSLRGRTEASRTEPFSELLRDTRKTKLPGRVPSAEQSQNKYEIATARAELGSVSRKASRNDGEVK